MSLTSSSCFFFLSFFFFSNFPNLQATCHAATLFSMDYKKWTQLVHIACAYYHIWCDWSLAQFCYYHQIKSISCCIIFLAQAIVYFRLTSTREYVLCHARNAKAITWVKSFIAPPFRTEKGLLKIIKVLFGLQK